ncbi:MAG: RICIN domain-containing protein [Alphaproteobacteria bacterium]|nr:RICIN domain-containing protein [Alphaproteobacteria bacterium]
MNTHLWHLCRTALLLLVLPLSVQAAPPQLQTPSPVIYLADNLDEEDNLGWCIDTLGRGFAETLQAHSCKPQGGDVQFSYDANSGQIASVPFKGKCMSLRDPENRTVPFGLVDCRSGDDSQRFVYQAETGHIHPSVDSSLCVVVAAQSRSAGPFMSRDLTLGSCDETDPVLARWIVK